MQTEEQFGEKAMSKTVVQLINGKELHIVYDCTEAHFQKTLKRWLQKSSNRTRNFSGESLCEELHRTKPYCIAVTEEQYQDILHECGITEESMLPREVSNEEYEAQLRKESKSKS